MVSSGIDIEEVDNVTVNNPVHEVSGRPAEYQGEDEPVVLIPDYKGRYQSHCQQGNYNKKSIAEALEHAERGPYVLHVDDIEEGQHPYDIKRAYVSPYKILCKLVEDEYGQGDEEEEGGLVLHVMALQHLSQICGWASNLPTDVLQFQHRSHLAPEALSTFMQRFLMSALS